MHANMCSEHVELLLHLLFHHRMLSRSEGILQVHTWLGSLEYMLLLTTFWYIVFSECKRNVSVNYCRSGFKITNWRERKTVLWRSFFFFQTMCCFWLIHSCAQRIRDQQNDASGLAVYCIVLLFSKMWARLLFTQIFKNKKRKFLINTREFSPWSS